MKIIHMITGGIIAGWLLGHATLSQAGSYNYDEIAEALAERDAIAGSPMIDRLDQFRLMAERVGNQCKRKGDAEDTAGGVAAMVVRARQNLEQIGVFVTHYELMDMLYSLLGDGQIEWNCSAALAMYVATREGNPPPAHTHISAYKLLQELRDRGMLEKASP
ncbi:hypothetical protein [Stutzerimonas kirkiae]|uniref:hypothetical protein n=1 Tax=Stutzerimonas kirkiae TaxID=2211392 RepID=UPI00103830FC|nr:hypothetical protein [Stutzerimonas kirkiae]TBV12772.1 hypothetical protein DNK01_13890 [Stutzerimonas kirkiae]